MHLEPITDEIEAKYTIQDELSALCERKKLGGSLQPNSHSQLT
jgi:hypothetical protein